MRGREPLWLPALLSPYSRCPAEYRRHFHRVQRCVYCFYLSGCKYDTGCALVPRHSLRPMNAGNGDAVRYRPYALAGGSIG